jgi:hypothetical protein
VVRFSYRIVPEVYPVFWAGMAAGEFINDAAIAAGSDRKQGARVLAAVGGARPRRGRNLKGRCLRLAQREEIALGWARGDSIRAIAAIVGWSPSTVSRELRRNADGLGRYRATSAHALAYHCMLIAGHSSCQDATDRSDMRCRPRIQRTTTPPRQARLGHLIEA